MSLDNIMVFIQVVESGSFSAAARHLQLSNALVSKRISQLEASLGLQLLYRTTRKLSLTEAGQRYYQEVRLIPTQLNHAKEVVAPLHHTMTGKLRVAVPTGFDRSLQQHVVPEYMLQYPEIELELVIDGHTEQLFDKGFDVLVLAKEPDQRFADTSWVSRRILDLPAGIYATPSYLAQYGEPKTPDDIAAHNCISYPGRETWPFVMAKGEKREFPAPGNLRTNSNMVLRGAVLQDVGIAFSFSYLFQEELEVGKVVPILQGYLPKNMLELYVFYPHSHYMPKKTRVFIDALVDKYNR